MDILQILEELRAERKRITEIIVALERFGVEDDPEPGPKQRGRKYMDRKGRQEVSQRMKQYWKTRRKSETDGPVKPGSGKKADSCGKVSEPPRSKATEQSHAAA